MPHPRIRYTRAASAHAGRRESRRNMPRIRIPALILAILALTACAPSQSAIQTAIAGTQSAQAAVPTQAAKPLYIPTPDANLPLTPPPPLAYAVIEAFKSAGLEAEGARPVTASDYGMAPYLCTGLRFLIPSLGPDNGGRLFVCNNPDDLEALKGYYQSMGEKGSEFFSWIFVKGTILLQINGSLPEPAALKYEDAIP